MKTVADVRNRLAAEIDHWFPRQCADLGKRFHLYHRETCAEYDGGFLIAADQPKDYLATAPMSCGETRDQAYNRLLKIVMRLPILAREGQ